MEVRATEEAHGGPERASRGMRAPAERETRRRLGGRQRPGKDQAKPSARKRWLSTPCWRPSRYEQEPPEPSQTSARLVLSLLSIEQDLPLRRREDGDGDWPRNPVATRSVVTRGTDSSKSKVPPPCVPSRWCPGAREVSVLTDGDETSPQLHRQLLIKRPLVLRVGPRSERVGRGNHGQRQRSSPSPTPVNP